MKDFKDILEKLNDFLPRIKRYLPVLFVVLLLAIYGFLAYRVNLLNDAAPSSSDVASKSKTTQVPHIDPKVIAQLQNLQDNSVSVKALFDQARDNPFQE